MEGSSLPFLAVGRVRDAMSLATLSFAETSQKSTQMEEIFKKLLTAAKIKLNPGQRTRLQWNAGSVCCLMDQQGVNLYCVVTQELKYPERFAYQLLQDVMASVQDHGDLDSLGENELTAELEPRMRELIDKYENPNNFEELQAALGKVGVLKSVMQDNLKTMQNQGRDVQDLQGRTENMAQSSRVFVDQAHELRGRHQRKNMRIMICVVVVILLILALFLVGSLYHRFLNNAAGQIPAGQISAVAGYPSGNFMASTV
uniref:V-SNARE coiled-coil homology domain-containing protein n=1 Tax=Noctiluca scintillans TaxID=2966 RepID=A0A7S1AYP7_NOCSC|mmetsp:Transcript_65270/g.173065  ORF Transcript_65270/g.173065 Transcript_65270/m.173065 type:complete len:257 (+) Transcript_65270:66-836(+)|eukprot:CAMPEP_0194483336 /NCGR_PEP_ID=MMETSP0253-20130528/4997_1 /TAXON_ID=2966 /ORGANISM="Noctiluca scintillans" /LENGTH=256 /DNA_ID=CAMNT_0039322995 /DNA_START=65 /DNA_END=835 /DNA_ORIENTATION=-